MITISYLDFQKLLIFNTKIIIFFLFLGAFIFTFSVIFNLDDSSLFRKKMYNILSFSSFIVGLFFIVTSILFFTNFSIFERSVSTFKYEMKQNFNSRENPLSDSLTIEDLTFGNSDDLFNIKEYHGSNENELDKKNIEYLYNKNNDMLLKKRVYSLGIIKIEYNIKEACSIEINMADNMNAISYKRNTPFLLYKFNVSK